MEQHNEEQFNLKFNQEWRTTSDSQDGAKSEINLRVTVGEKLVKTVQSLASLAYSVWKLGVHAP